MKVLVFLSVLLVSSLCYNSIHQQLMKDLFTQWKLTHNKAYKVGYEDELRFNIFTQNYISILQFNQEQSDVTLGLNHFADLTREEFRALYTGLSTNHLSNANTGNLYLNDLPPSVDWRSKGAVTPVKNQASCGSCWAFSAVGALEGLYFVDHNKLVSFSEQQIVDCVKTETSKGCNGGWMNDVFEYVATEGIETEEDYPYKARDQQCQYDASKAIKVNIGYVILNRNATVLKTGIVANPVSVGVEADQIVFQFYKTGVIKSNCGADLNHGVLAVGYDTINGVEAYIVKNSWGANWGKSGYVYISTDPKPNGGNGVCGILMAASYPVSH